MQTATHHQFERTLGRTDGAHAVMDTTRSKANL
jgi:hypothetical protein